jgi:hypothetical protein
MSWGEWILVGVGAAQAVALAIAAWFAWRTYKAAQRERDASRLQPVITVANILAEVVATYNTAGSGIEKVFGKQARLRASLDFLPSRMLPQTRLLARLDRDDLLEGGQIEAARLELAEALDGVSPPSFGQLSGND